MDGKQSGVEVAVATFGSEGLRIVSLIIGFSVVQLVLLLAAYRSKRQNVNKLIAFVLLLAGAVGILTLIATPVINKLESFGKNVVVGIVALIVIALFIVGLLMQMGFIRVPFAKVGMINDLPASRSKTNLESVSSVFKQPEQWDLQTMYDQGIRWFIGFHTDASIKKEFSFVATHQDCIFISLGSSKTRMAHPSNLLRLMTTEQDQLSGAKCYSKDKKMHFVSMHGEKKIVESENHVSPEDAITLSKDSQNAFFFSLSPQELEEFVQEHANHWGGADIWLSQNSAFDTPSTEVWNFLRKTNARLQMSQSFAMKPFKNTRNILAEEAMMLVYECVLGAQEDLRTTVDILGFIGQMPHFVKFNVKGDRDDDNLLIVSPTADDTWHFKGKFTTCKSE